MDFPSHRRAVQERWGNPSPLSGNAFGGAVPWEPGAGQVLGPGCLSSYQVALNSRQAVKGLGALQTALSCTKRLNYNYCQRYVIALGDGAGEQGRVCPFAAQAGSPE